MLQEVQISNFTAGELSPRMKGRTDYAKYFNGLETELNMVTMPQGGSTRRPGTAFGALGRDQSATPFREKNLPFVFSTVQAYQLEFSQGWVRVFMNDAPVANPQAISAVTNNGGGAIRLTVGATAHVVTGGQVVVAGVGGTVEANGTWTVTVIDTVHIDLQGSTFVNAYTSGGTAQFYVDVALPYQAADLPALQYTQSADTFYLTHPNYPPATLTRSSHIAWSYQALVFRDGPYLPAGTAGVTLTPSATSGAITLTASAVTGINGGAGFLAGDVGRAVRLQNTNGTSNAYGWCFITGIISTTVVNATVQTAVPFGAQGTLQGTNATPVWQLGAWSTTTGFPYCTGFWQQRLALGGNNNSPNSIWQSVTGDFTNMAPTAADGTVSAANSLNFTISDDQVNAIRWLSAAGSAQAMQLGIGVSGSEDIMQAATTSQALSAANVQVYRETSYGSAPNVRPLRIGKAMIFADITGRKLREWMFYWQVNGYLGLDKTQASEHITRGPVGSLPSTWGIRGMCYQQSPHQVIWAIRNDGQLISFTYDAEQQVFAPSHHVLGGQYYGGPPLVESICTIPSPDATYDEVWLVVLRTINGVPTRFVEVMTRFFDALPIEQAVFVDAASSSALTMPAFTLTPSGLTNLNTLHDGTPDPTLQPVWGTLFNSAGVAVPGIFTASGAAFAGTSTDVGLVIRANGGMAVVIAPISTTQVSAQVIRPLINLAPAASGSWSATAPITSPTGIGYANGETVGVFADGADQGTQTAVNGGVTLSVPASYVTIGFPTTAALVTMPFAPKQAMQISTEGKAKRVDHMYLRLHESVGCKYGRRITDDSTYTITDTIEELQNRSAGMLMNQPPPTFSGMKRLAVPGGFDLEGQVIVTATGPMPLTVLSIVATADIGDMGP